MTGLTLYKMGKKTLLVFPTPTHTILNQYGYGIRKAGNEELVEQLKGYLMAKPKVSFEMTNQETPAFPVFAESENRLYIPRYFGLQTFGPPMKEALGDGEEAPRLVFQGTTRKEQEEPIQAFLEAAKDPCKGGGLLVLPCGAGKTACSLYIATVLKRKTLVICHKEFLMNQWKERIDQFIPSARVGRIKQSNVQVNGYDIVLASLQSLSMREYDPQIFKQFGLVIVDECHHIGAEVFSRCLPKVTSRYMLGLSATPNRKDGLRKVFEWHIGKPVYERKKRDDNDLIVRVQEFYDPHPDYGRERVLWNGKKNVVQMINAICNFEPRNEMIMDLLVDIKKKEHDRKVLILSERRKHLEALNKMIKARKLGTTGFYVGGMSQEELKESETKDFILATYHIAAEGFDVPALNTLVLASPVSAIEQPVGRIQRQKPSERQYTPLVIDIWDQFSLFRGQGLRRFQFYKKNGYKMEGWVDSSEVDECEEAPKRKVEFIDDDE